MSRKLLDLRLHKNQWKIIAKLFITVLIHFHFVLFPTFSSSSSLKSMCVMIRWLILSWNINVCNDSMADFELDHHYHLINSRLWLTKTLRLIIWYMITQPNNWNVIILWINKLFRDQMYINIYVCYAVGYCVAINNG